MKAGAAEALTWGRSTVAQRLVGALVMVAGLAMLSFVALNLGRDVSLWFFGRHIDAQVVGKWIERDAQEGEGDPTFRYYLRYRFQTPDGQEVTGVSRMAAQEWSAVEHVGSVDVVSPDGAGTLDGSVGATEGAGTVDVVYFPAYPAHNRLDESRFVTVVACAYVPLVALGCTGLAAGRRLLMTG
ncbi:MAG: DUF3592 domain-containing protein [Anaerolineae bacterium]|jgi:hypothetical protein